MAREETAVIAGILFPKSNAGAQVGTSHLLTALYKRGRQVTMLETKALHWFICAQSQALWLEIR